MRGCIVTCARVISCALPFVPVEQQHCSTPLLQCDSPILSRFPLNLPCNMPLSSPGSSSCQNLCECCIFSICKLTSCEAWFTQDQRARRERGGGGAQMLACLPHLQFKWCEPDAQHRKIAAGAPVLTMFTLNIVRHLCPARNLTRHAPL